MQTSPISGNNNALAWQKLMEAQRSAWTKQGLSAGKDQKVSSAKAPIYTSLDKTPSIKSNSDPRAAALELLTRMKAASTANSSSVANVTGTVKPAATTSTSIEKLGSENSGRLWQIYNQSAKAPENAPIQQKILGSRFDSLA